MREVDCIIVGQGIAGTLLSFELIDAGLSVLVFDTPHHQGASLVASGVINPVTGRRVVETWQIDTLLPLAQRTYNKISEYLSVPPVASPIEVLALHANEQMRMAYEKRLKEGSSYIKGFEAKKMQGYLKDLSNGAHIISPALLIDLQTLLPAYKANLQKHQQVVEKRFNWDQLQQTSQHNPLVYSDADMQIKAKWVIATEGVEGASNPYFNELPFRYNKGEALIISAAALPRDYIYKLNYSIVPWKGEDLFWVGSTYQWEFKDALPTASFKQSVTKFLDDVLSVPYEVVDHIASVRPASVNRRPFAGFHEKSSRIGVLNGLGTKGCSLAPLLAHEWREHLTSGKAFNSEVAINGPRQ